MRKEVLASFLYVAIAGAFAANGAQSSSGNVSSSSLEDMYREFATSHTRRNRRSFYFPTQNPLICPPCEQIHCYKHRMKRLYCKGGWTLDICGCCRVCGKLEGEACGGEHNYLGRCDNNLFCNPQPPTLLTVFVNGANKIYKHQKGICKKELLKVKPLVESCKPKCHPEYCAKNPRAICSATENSEKSQMCQGSCQHTSCRACKFIEPIRKCPKCEKNNFKCIRDFGRCVRKNSCKAKKYPCGNDIVMTRHEGLFLCQVPECK